MAARVGSTRHRIFWKIAKSPKLFSSLRFRERYFALLAIVWMDGIKFSEGGFKTAPAFVDRILQSNPGLCLSQSNVPANIDIQQFARALNAGRSK
jgi:hypothetical protein